MLPVVLINTFAVIFLINFYFFINTLNIKNILGSFVSFIFYLALHFFLRFKTKSNLPNYLLLFWTIFFLVSSHFILKKNSVIWKGGFTVNEDFGWYPIKNQKNKELVGNNKEYFVSTDKFGHRNDNSYDSIKTKDIVIQGDSNTFGYGLNVDETICKKIEALRNIQCFNLGISGFDTQHYFFQYKKFSNLFHDNERFILFNTGNDYSLSALSTPYLLPRPFLFQNNNLEVILKDDISIPFKKQAYGHKFLPIYSEYNAKIKNVIIGRNWGDWMPQSLSKFHLFIFFFDLIYPIINNFIIVNFYSSELKYGKLLTPYYPDWQLKSFQEWPEPYKKYWNQFKILLQKISEQQSKKTTLVLFPFKQQITEYRKLMTQDIFSIQKKIADESKKNNLKVLDLTTVFLNHKNQEALYQKDDHLSALGIEIISNSISNNLLIK